MAFKKNPDSNPSGGGPNDSCWNMKGYNMAPAAPVVPQKWNTRFDWMPKDPHSTYRAKGGNAPFNPPLGMNVGKVPGSTMSNAPKGK